MQYTHKLSRRLALLKGAALVVAVALAGCGEQSTSPLTGLDEPASALSPNDAPPGTRVRTTRWVQVFASPTSSTFSKQPIRAVGTTVAGPAGLQHRPRWQVNFDQGPDGWVLGASLAVVSSAPSVGSVTLTPPTLSVAVGATAQLTAAVRDAAGNTMANAAVTWASTNPATAMVSGTGLVRGMASGSASVIATSSGRADTTAVTVSAAPTVPVATVAVTPATASVAAGGTTQLNATLRDAAGNVLTGRAVSWTTGNAAAATVSSAGLVTGVATGAATITAASEGQSGTAAVTVTPPPSVPVATVTVTPPTAAVVVGGIAQLTATLRDAAGNVLTGRAINWTSSGGAASVSPSGLVSGVAPGTATITATSEGRSAGSTVTVTQPSPGTALFASAWSTGTGTSPRVLYDSASATPWNMHIGNGHLSEVVPSAGLDFPSPNVLRVTAGYRDGGGATADNVRLNNGLPLLDVGASRFYRWYIRVVVPDSYNGDGQTHPIQDGTNGSVTNWMFQVFAGQGTWTLSWSVESAWPNNRWICRTALSKGRTYRVELRVTRLAAGTMTMASRVYDAQGNLVCGEGAFDNIDASSTLLSQPVVAIRNADYFRGFQVGFNGLDSGTPDQFPMVLYYQGAVCVRSDNWCGPYSGGQ